MDDPQDDPQDGAAGISRRILARIVYIVGHVDSKWIVTKVVYRKNNNKGGGAY